MTKNILRGALHNASVEVTTVDSGDIARASNQLYAKGVVNGVLTAIMALPYLNELGSVEEALAEMERRGLSHIPFGEAFKVLFEHMPDVIDPESVPDAWQDALNFNLMEQNPENKRAIHWALWKQ